MAGDVTCPRDNVTGNIIKKRLYISLCLVCVLIVL